MHDVICALHFPYVMMMMRLLLLLPLGYKRSEKRPPADGNL
jgi:hypothetical protein